MTLVCLVATTLLLLLLIMIMMMVMIIIDIRASWCCQVISLPSQTCTYKVKITETSLVVKADIITFRGTYAETEPSRGELARWRCIISHCTEYVCTITVSQSQEKKN